MKDLKTLLTEYKQIDENKDFPLLGYNGGTEFYFNVTPYIKDQIKLSIYNKSNKILGDIVYTQNFDISELHLYKNVEQLHTTLFVIKFISIYNDFINDKNLLKDITNNYIDSVGDRILNITQLIYSK